MLDSGASHNLMPKSEMEKLNLDITRPYRDLFSFDSSQVECLGLIKDLCVTLVQYPAKSILMDIVVAGIPPKYGMLLSRSWGASFKDPSNWTCHMPQFLCLDNPRNYTKKLS